MTPLAQATTIAIPVAAALVAWRWRGGDPPDAPVGSQRDAERAWWNSRGWWLGGIAGALVLMALLVSALDAATVALLVLAACVADARSVLGARGHGSSLSVTSYMLSMFAGVVLAPTADLTPLDGVVASFWVVVASLVAQAGLLARHGRATVKMCLLNSIGFLAFVFLTPFSLALSPQPSQTVADTVEHLEQDGFSHGGRTLEHLEQAGIA